MYWIINDKIEFRPASKMLISLDNPDIYVVLTAPATRCLLLMLEAAPELVTHQEFFKIVWEDEGMLVPPNTLYQNISIIRRGLRAVDESNHLLISTVPRKGFHFDKNANIIHVVPEQANNNNTYSSGSPDEYVGVINSTNENDENICSLFLIRLIKSALRKDLFIYFFIAFFLIIGIVIGNLIFPVSATKPFFIDYSFVEKRNGCNFYSNEKNNESSNSFEQSKNIILNSGLSCKKYPWVYIYSSVSSPGLIAFACRNKYTDLHNPGCLTLSFRGI